MARLIRLSDGSLLFRAGYHELAWSRRTSGMPLYSVFLSPPSSGGERKWVLEYLGDTQKAPAIYKIQPTTYPEAQFVCVLWVYWSNKGYLRVTAFYPSASGEEAKSVSLYETEDFTWDSPVYNEVVAEFLDVLEDKLMFDGDFYNAISSSSKVIEIPKTICSSGRNQNDR